MTQEERLRVNKVWYRLELYLIKVIPMLFSGLTLLNTVLSYFYIDLPILSYLGSVSVLTLAFMYLSSKVFGFCLWHRMFIHYTAVNWLLNIYDYYLGIPISNRGLLMLYLIIAGIFLFIILWLRFRK